MSVTNTYENQQMLYDAIKKIGVNIKKDGWERKNSDYFKRRIQLLENQWSDFQYNHDSLSTEVGSDHPYITSDLYDRTWQCYKEVKDLIVQQHRQLATPRRSSGGLSIQQATSVGANPQGGNLSSRQEQTEQLSHEEEDFSKMKSNKCSEQILPEQQHPGPSRLDTGCNSKLDDTMRKQSANFRAFMKAAADIQVEFIEEKWEFQDALQTLQARWLAIDNLHWEIESELNGEMNSIYAERYGRLECQFKDLKRALNTKMWRDSYREKTTPKLAIPNYNGNFSQWISFRDLFVEAIHNNPSLSQAQKMQFLKGKVQGEAEKLIQHLRISSDNYQVCWDILNHRYNNEKRIATAHLDALLGLPNMQQPSVVQIKRLHDVTWETLHAIDNLGVTRDTILVYLLSQKLDSETESDYIDSLRSSRELPQLKDFLEFLERKFTSMETSSRKQDKLLRIKTSQNQYQEASNSKKQANNYYHHSNGSNNNKKYTKSCHVSAFTCPLCNNEHGIYNCSKFLEMPNQTKLNTVNKLRLCINCLFSHNGNKCTSTKRCRSCSRQHNTLLHEAFTKTEPEKSTNTSHVTQNTDTSEILLATAILKVAGNDGTQHRMRALIDQGSQVSLITESAAQLLGIKRQRCKGVIFGVGQKENNCKGLITITCSSCYNDFKFETSAIIMNNLINNLPNKTFTKPSWSYIQNINLADPEFYKTRPVDLLLGADIYSRIMLGGMIKGDNATQPIAQQTLIGWVLCGEVKTFQCNVVLNQLDDMKQFWEAEEISREPNLSLEDSICIEHYNKTTRRLEDGRYEVRLPMKSDAYMKLGSSKPMAIAQLKNLEQKFKKQKHLANAYKEFMSEYIDLDHMAVAKQSTSNMIPECYLPHHGVQRAESTTTKYRVVFNASAKTSTGWSLNDLMYPGPNLQQDLQTLLIKWRQYQYAYTADIEKMYRQILMADCDQQLQKIVWRDSVEQTLRSYQLKTVTYGTKAAPFLAMMTLRRLAADERKQFPEASRVLEEHFYMDDLVHGSHTAEQGKQCISDLNQLLTSGGFNLRKWATNNPELLEKVHGQKKEEQFVFNFKTEQTSKTLGLCWNPRDDMFSFQCTMSESNEKNTKRKLLAEISKLFDPLGWLTPVSTKLKLLFQKLWEAKLQWDEEVSDNINKEWCKIQADIKAINSCEIPRWLMGSSRQIVELHGFSDASLEAYACVIYARTQRPNRVVLVAAKSKIVPQRKIITLPRLELNGAHLLSKLMHKVKESLNQYETSLYGWTDSMVVLGWLQGDPARWKAYVGNRVQQIIDVIPPSCWNYVRSKDNPADSASRGQYASQLLKNELWWQGPTWLSLFEANKLEIQRYTTDEEKKTFVGKLANTTLANTKELNIIEQLLQNHSCLNHIIRIVAWILRALNPRRRQLPRHLTLQELNNATRVTVKQTQQKSFALDINNLQKHGRVLLQSKLLPLNPLIDQHGILRVGGRLRNAALSEDMKYPMIIPHESRLSHLIIDQAHRMTFHGGPRLTLSHLRQKYWILSGNRVTKMQVRRCVTCRKINPSKQQQLMGDLPHSRTNPAPAFYHTGVDYTGFVDIKMNKGRGARTTKGYIAVFVCMVTKAVHLELVSDLTSATFLAALSRMAARRGTPCHLYSDNGTNFVGANRLLTEQYGEIEDSFRNEQLQRQVIEMNIHWHFNAPAWPSSGGLWERAVRSLKHHLRRVVGEQKLTFEEFTTVLTKLEACLNSRPLCPLSDNVEDLDCLTPAHFLTGRPGLTVIETIEDARTRWKLTRMIFLEIWKRWRVEYLCQQQVRSKWREPRQNLTIGDLVVVHDDHLPAGKWLLGRVTDLHPGDDGYVRVVSLRTKQGNIKRPIIKVSVLPVNKDEDKATSEQQPTEKKILTSDQTHNKPTRSRQARSTFKQINFIGLVMSLLYLLNPTTAGNTTNIVQLQQNLYFDKVTNMQLIRDEWKIVVFYDVKPYWESIVTFIKYTDRLENICREIKQRSQCGVILLQLRHALEELLHYNGILLNTQGRRNLRSKRGLINGVGSIARSLFGVLDDQFAEQYQRDITLVKENEKHLAALAKNQTSVIEAEYNLLKRSEETVQKQYKLFNQHLLNLEKYTNTLQKEIVSQELSIEFVMSAIAANSLIEHIRNVQETLLDTVTNIYNGKMNLHLITPEQMQEELNIISGHLSKDVTLPITNIQTEYFRLYHIIQVKAKITQKYLIIEMKVPLISRENHEVYNVIPVPEKTDKEMVTLLPLTELLAINLQKDSYLPLTGLELQHCLQHEAITRLCALKTPVYRIQSDENFCVKNKEASNCQTKHEICHDTWLELNTINRYLYFCCEVCKIHIICGQQVTTQLLRRAGIITLYEDCIIKSEAFTLYSQKQPMNEIQARADFVPVVIPPINNIFNVSIPVLKHEDENSVSEVEQKELFKSVDKQVKQLNAASEEGILSERITYHDVHQYIVLYLLLTAIVLASGIYGFLRLRKRSTSQPHPEGLPIPIPRKRSTTSIVGNVIFSEADNAVSRHKQLPGTHKLEKMTSPVARSDMLT